MENAQHRTALLISDGDLKSSETTVVVDRPLPSFSPSVSNLLNHDHDASVIQPQYAELINLSHQIFETVATSPDLEATLARIAILVGTAFRVDGCLIAMAGKVALNAQAVYWRADTPPSVSDAAPPKSLPPQPVRVSLPNLSTWLDNIEPIAVANANESLAKASASHAGASKLMDLWQAVALPELRLSPMQSALGLSTQFQGCVNGVISLMRSQPYAWTESEIEGLRIVSHQVAIALSQLQFQRQIRQQAQYQTVINQLTLAIRNSSDLNEILKLALAGVATALPVQRAMLIRLKYWDPLFRARAQGQVPKIRLTVAHEWVSGVGLVEPGRSPEYTSTTAAIPENNPSFWMSECALCQQAFTDSDRPLIIADRDQLLKGGAVASIAPIFKLDELPSLLMTPLESQGTVLGFLVLQHRSPQDWQAEELELVELVSAQVSTAIIQTETLRQVQGLVEKRTAELRESLAVQAKLYERTRQQVDQLRHLNQLKDEFLSTVSHELRTPLTSMTMAIRMLRQVGASSDRGGRYLDILEQQCAQETNLVNDLLALQELESKQTPMQCQELDLKALIDELSASFEEKWAAKGLTFVLNLPEKPLRLYSDRDSLSRILLELLTNASKYSDPNSTIRLHVATVGLPPTSDVILTLSNTGPGISPTELPHIFDKFRRGQGVTQDAIQGTGLGLALVQSLVNHLNGSIVASSCDTEETQCCETAFTLTLPQNSERSRA